MKKVFLLSLVLTVAGIAGAANVPTGITGLWRFQNTANFGQATIGNDITFLNSPYGTWFLGPWTDIGIESWHTKFSDGTIFQEQSWNYIAVDPGFIPNGGGVYVNQYTIAFDYQQTSALGTSNSLFQTSYNGNVSDGDLWVTPAGKVGSDALGYSATTIDPSQWHRFVLSVDNGNFFRVYVDGTLLLDAPGQPVDGQFSLYPNRFNLFADDSWQDAWGLVGNVMTWSRALTTAEISGMGGWIGAATAPTPLIFGETPEITSVLPWDGETNVPPAFTYQATIVDVLGIVDTNTIQLLLDGAPLTPVVTASEASMLVKFSGGGLLPSGSIHTYTLIGGSSGIFATNEVTFTVQRYSSYEWNFASGNLSAALGNGVMEYANPSTTPGLTSFGTTDGSTVPHINGIPAKYMHVARFTDESDGYWLTFTDSGPNVNGSDQINKYTLLMDILVPSPWVTNTWIVPFFNTDPYDLNDADFYLYGDGSVGILGIYSGPGVMTPSTWYRVAFVADLEADTLTHYVNGTAVGSRGGDGLAGRWAMYSNQDAGPDLLLFNEGDPSGIYTHELYLSSVAYVDRNFSAAEIAALGGPKASGILVSSFAPPTLTAKHSGSGVVISWSTNSVGYTLEGKTSLADSTWAPVPGVTNNALALPSVSGNRFFRLAR